MFPTCLVELSISAFAGVVLPVLAATFLAGFLVGLVTNHQPDL